MRHKCLKWKHILKELVFHIKVIILRLKWGTLNCRRNAVKRVTYY